VDIKGRRPWLYAATDDIVSRGTFQTLRELLLRRRRRIVGWLSAYAVLPLVLAVEIVVGAVVVGVRFPRSSILFGGSLGIVALCFLVIVANLWFSFRNPNLVILVPRRDAPGFWSRNGERLLVSGVVAVIGAVIGAVVTYLLTRPSAH
jgi:hypothetical protein